MNIALMSPEQWGADPRSKSLPPAMALIETLKALDPFDRFAVQAVFNTGFAWVNEASRFHGWRIRKGSFAKDFVSRKAMLDQVLAALDADRAGYLASLGAMRVAGLAKLLEEAGVQGGKYMRKAQKVQALIAWAEGSRDLFAKNVAEASWYLTATSSARRGEPVNETSARQFGLWQTLVSQYAYESNGEGFLVKGDGGRWVVNGRDYTKPEIKERVTGCAEALRNFDAQTRKLIAELRAIHNGPDHARVAFLRRCIPSRVHQHRAGMVANVTAFQSALTRHADKRVCARKGQDLFLLA